MKKLTRTPKSCKISGNDDAALVCIGSLEPKVEGAIGKDNRSSITITTRIKEGMGSIKITWANHHLPRYICFGGKITKTVLP